LIRFIKPHLPRPEEWTGYLEPAYCSAWYSNFGAVHERFADELTKKYGAGGRVAIPVASGTAGLVAALMALDVRGEVVVPSFTFVATAQAVRQADCTPVFCDIDRKSWMMSASSLRSCLSSRQAGAVVAVRSYGLPHDFTDIEKVCADFGVPLVIDSAAALGGRLDDGQWIGNQGTAEVFSLHATKVFAVGEGGAVMCAAELAQPLREVINFGLHGTQIRRRGINGKMDEFSSAIGLASIGKIDSFIHNRCQYAEFYRQRLSLEAGSGMLELPPREGHPTFQTFPVRLRNGMDAGEVVEQARRLGLELRRYYFPAMHTETIFRSSDGVEQLPVTEMMSASMICLPLYSEMDGDVLEEVVRIFRTVLRFCCEINIEQTGT
jgi:dTDP-4-amino-4,6-dideoxygalactose transaminase